MAELLAMNNDFTKEKLRSERIEWDPCRSPRFSPPHSCHGLLYRDDKATVRASLRISSIIFLYFHHVKGIFSHGHLHSHLCTNFPHIVGLDTTRGGVESQLQKGSLEAVKNGFRRSFFSIRL